MNKLLLFILVLSGCNILEREWNKVPPGVYEYCNKRATEEEIKQTQNGRSVFAEPFVICENQYHCTCVIKFH